MAPSLPFVPALIVPLRYLPSVPVLNKSRRSIPLHTIVYKKPSWGAGSLVSAGDIGVAYSIGIDTTLALSASCTWSPLAPSALLSHEQRSADVFMNKCFHIFQIPRRVIAGPYGNHLSFVEEPPICFPQGLPHFAFPPAVNEGPPSPTTSPALALTSRVDDRLSDRWEVASTLVFICIGPLAPEAEHLFVVCRPSGVSLGEGLSRSSAHCSLALFVVAC